MKKYKVAYWNVEKDRIETLEFNNKIDASIFARRLKKSIELVRVK